MQALSPVTMTTVRQTGTYDQHISCQVTEPTVMQNLYSHRLKSSKEKEGAYT